MAKRKTNSLLSLNTLNMLLEDNSDAVFSSSTLYSDFEDRLATSILADVTRNNIDIEQLELIMDQAQELLGYDSTHDSKLGRLFVSSIELAARSRILDLNSTI